eukprot:RCo050893
MPFITLDLLRRRAEHNEGCLRDLKELTLHQQDLERIDLINDHCRELEILYLQNNLISKIENLFHLKYLWYLNLAVNNITVVENLEGLESLKKLDLTLNFVADLTSIENLAANPNLRSLHLTGNPCTSAAGYRSYVIDVLPQLTELDSAEIKQSERIRAHQDSEEARLGVQALKAKAAAEEAEKRRKKELGIVDPRPVNEKGEPLYGHSPEERMACYRDMQAEIESRTAKKEPSELDKLMNPAPAPTLSPAEELEKYGRVLQKNQAKLPYELTEAAGRVELRVGVPKFLSTSLIEVDVQPSYVRVIVKGKVLQLVLPREVAPDRCTVQRAQVD